MRREDGRVRTDQEVPAEGARKGTTEKYGPWKRRKKPRGPEDTMALLPAHRLVPWIRLENLCSSGWG